MVLHKSSGRWQLGIGLALVTAVLWGMLPIALKLLLQQGDALTISWLRFLASGLILVGFHLQQRRGGELLDLLRTGGRTRLLLWLGVLGLTGNYVFYLFGLALVPPAAAQVLIQLAPLSMLLGGLWIFRETFGLAQWLGLVLVLAGQALFFLPGLLAGVGARMSVFGLFLIVLAALVWAVYALAQKQLLARWPSPLVMCLIYLLCALILLPASKPASLATLDPLGIGLLLFTVFNTLVAYGAFAEALNHVEASRVSLVLAITPLLTIGFVHLGSVLFPSRIDSNHLPLIAIAGAVLVVAGSALSAVRRRGV